MNILYCGDGNITDGIFMSALSLAKNTDEKLDIFILTAGVSERNCPIPESFAEKLEKATLATIEDGIMTGDLARLASPAAKKIVNSWEYIDEIASRL